MVPVRRCDGTPKGRPGIVIGGDTSAVWLHTAAEMNELLVSRRQADKTKRARQNTTRHQATLSDRHHREVETEEKARQQKRPLARVEKSTLAYFSRHEASAWSILRYQ